MECVDKVMFLGLLGFLHSLKKVALTAVEVCDTINSSVRDFYEGHFVCTSCVSFCIPCVCHSTQTNKAKV